MSSLFPLTLLSLVFVCVHLSTILEAANEAAAEVCIEEVAVQRDVDICNIPRISAAEFTHSLFFSEYYQLKPFILVNYTLNAPHFRSLAHIDRLLESYGHERILAASANTYSHEKMKMTFREYVELIRSQPITLKNESDATAYFFGDHDDPGMYAGDEEDEAYLEEQIKFDQRISACINQSSLASSDLNSLASSSFDQCSMALSREEPMQASSQKQRPIWSKLLRQYHPPPYVIPVHTSTSRPKVTNDEHEAPQVDELDFGIRRVKLSATTFDAHQQLFAAGDMSTTSSTSLPPLRPSTLPPRFDYARYSFGIAGHRSGVPFHFHGAAIGEVLHGRKRWFMYPPKPDSSTKIDLNDPTASLPFPAFRPELTQLQWLTHIYPNLAAHELPVQCTLHPEELIYVPPNWYHATMNLGEVSVFISSFIDEGRMAAVMKEMGMDTTRQTD